MEFDINNSYKIELSENWEYSLKENLLTIYRGESGVGAINISNYFLEPSTFNDLDLESELEGFIFSTLPNLDTTDLNIHRDNLFYFCGLIESNDFWKFAIIGKSNKVLFISYNCSRLLYKQELKEVKKIINSIKVFSDS